jgi:fructokinase
LEPPDWNFQEEFSLLYLGSLGSRSPQSRETIQHIKQTSGLPVFVDINLRPPWFEMAWLPLLLGEVTWLKLNLAELVQLSQISMATPTLDSEGADHDDSPGARARRESVIALATRRLYELHGCQKFWITCGSEGAYLATGEGGPIFAPAPPPEPMVDAVGGGDAFASITILGWHHGWDDRKTIDRAVYFASQVCQMQGATCEDPEFYQHEGAAR